MGGVVLSLARFSLVVRSFKISKGLTFTISTQSTSMGACRISFLVFVSDHSRSGLAKKLVQILDSLDVLP